MSTAVDGTIIVPDAFALADRSDHPIRITRHAIDRASTRVLDVYLRTRDAGDHLEDGIEGMFSWLLRLSSIALEFATTGRAVESPKLVAVREVHIIVLGVHLVLARAIDMPGEPMPATGWALATVFIEHTDAKLCRRRRRRSLR